MIFEQYLSRAGDIVVNSKLPILECPSCHNIVIPSYTKKAAQNAELCDSGEYAPTIENLRFDFCPNIEFVYSSIDWEVIPGLKQSEYGIDGYYVPVFFKKHVLLKYVILEYPMEYFKDGGSIHFSNGHDLEYGINRNGLLFCWLGDLDKIPVAEQHYMFSENVESDHDVVSGLYMKSRLNLTPGATNEQLLDRSMTRLNKTMQSKFHFKLHALNPVEIQLLEKLAKPVVWNDYVAVTIIGVMKVHIESLDEDMLNSDLRSLDKHAKKLKCLQLMDAWLQSKITENISNIIKPFKILIVWRNIFAHKSKLKTKKTLYWCNVEMGLSGDAKPEVLYDTIIEKMVESYDHIEHALAEYEFETPIIFVK